MAKDRFSRFKPINYSNSWRQVGHYIPTKPIKPSQQTEYLKDFYSQYKDRMSGWEREFVCDITKSPYTLTQKQKDTFRNLVQKYI